MSYFAELTSHTILLVFGKSEFIGRTNLGMEAALLASHVLEALPFS